MREIWMPLLQKYQISCLLSFWQIGICHLLHIVFPKTIIITTSAKIIPNAIYTKNAGKIFSNTPIINRRIAITDIPIPIVLHSFFHYILPFLLLKLYYIRKLTNFHVQKSKLWKVQQVL